MTAVFNGRDDIDEFITNVRQQSYPHVQLILVDGASTDGTVDVLQSRSNEIDTWISEPDDGLFEAWNKGIAASSGEWLIFLGVDDRFADPHALRDQLLAAAQDPSANLVVGRSRLLHADGSVGAVIGTGWNRQLMRCCMTVSDPSLLKRRSLLDDVGPFRPELGLTGDYEFLLRGLDRVRACNTERVVSLFGDQGVSSTNRPQVLRQVLEVQLASDQVSAPRALVQYAGFQVALPVRQALRFIRGRSTRGLARS